MLERGVPVRHTTIHRWTRRHATGLDTRSESPLNPVQADLRFVETLVQVEQQRKYLYRAMTDGGETLDFILYDTPDRRAAERFLRSHAGKCQYNTVPATGKTRA